MKQISWIVAGILTLLPSQLLAADVTDRAESLEFSEFIAELESIAVELEASANITREFVALQQSHGLAANDRNYQEFVRVRLMFEATRDSGLWQIKWAITDQEPNSDSIWSQWSDRSDRRPDIAQLEFENEAWTQPTAIAECDELSAMFAFLARKMGVRKVGLLWPTWNHTVAVWTAEGANGDPVRVLVPTSQIFISDQATLGSSEFDPNRQRVIYDYDRQDVPPDFSIPGSLANELLQQLRKFGGESADVLQARRNRLSMKFGGS